MTNQQCGISASFNFLVFDHHDLGYPSSASQTILSYTIRFKNNAVGCKYLACTNRFSQQSLVQQWERRRTHAATPIAHQSMKLPSEHPESRDMRKCVNTLPYKLTQAHPSRRFPKLSRSRIKTEYRLKPQDLDELVFTKSRFVFPVIMSSSFQLCLMCSIMWCSTTVSGRPHNMFLYN